MEEVGTQVASSFNMYNTISGRYPDGPPMPKKRGLPFQNTNFIQQQQFLQRLIPNLDDSRNSWNPKHWEWDSSQLVAKEISKQQQQQEQQHQQRGIIPTNSDGLKKGLAEPSEEDARLLLKLGGSLVSGEDTVTRPSKRVRSGSPGGGGNGSGGNYPMCQVDGCKEDLSSAKDYHRRHKVCELHSKAGQALLGKQLQRFCQQCSRFHPLSEFDEGKRSCRRRLAGHNRRRRKTQPEDVASHLLHPGNKKNNNGDVDIVNLLTVLAHAQGNAEDMTKSSSPLPNKDQLMQIINKINSLPSVPGNLNNGNQEKTPQKSQNIPPPQSQNKINTKTGSSTMDLLGVLSGGASPPVPLLQKRNQVIEANKTNYGYHDQIMIEADKTNSGYRDQIMVNSPHKQQPVTEVYSGGDRSSTSFQSRGEDSDCQVLDTPVNLQLQLFSSSPEDDSPPKLASSRKYFSSDSSSPMEDRSPSSSPPVVQRLFPTKSSRGRMMPESRSSSGNGGATVSLELFGGSNVGADNISIQSSPYRAGYTSSGSNQSPSSLNSDTQDRTGRILFKLFDKDPSHLPGSLRSQVFNWLSQSPSEMEGYIRPGCVVLSIYLSMSSSSWDQLEGNFLQYVNSLLQDSGTDFWETGRFLAHTEKQIASHKDGKVYLFTSLKEWSSPQLISVSPLAVVAGKETSLLLRGRNLTTAGTKIYCTHADGCTLEETIKSANQESTYEEIITCSFKIHAPSALGRCFIEIENGLRGTSFPVIIADTILCQELNLLESEFCDRSSSSKETLHFLNELGWLFQKKDDASNYSLTRFKFLLIFSVERDFCALVKMLLGILLQKGSSVSDDESCLEMLCGINLLNRAVNRRCKNMVDLLIHYSVVDSQSTTIKYVFPPNLVGPGGITPLHLAASTSDSDDMVDALTNDPQEIGLLSWNSSLDANGLSPFTYASMRNNNSYNILVAQKLTNRIAGQVSLHIPNEIELQTRNNDQQELSFRLRDHVTPKSCSKCAIVIAKHPRRIPGSQGLLHRPYIHSMLAIAAVCVCVCLFLRGAPDIGLVAPFKWENLNFGSM